MDGLWLSLLLKPFIAVVCLALPLLIAYAIWRLMPDSKIKRILFKHYGEKDNMPWTKAQEREAREKAARARHESLRPHQSLVAHDQPIGSDRQG